MMLPVQRGLFLLLLAVFSTTTGAQTQPQSGAPKPTAANGAITGRVTLQRDEPAAGVTVLLLASDRRGPQRQSLAKAVTDADGRYRLTNIGDGRYHVRPVAPAHVISGNTYQEEPGKIINLVNSETINDLNFQLVPGGVITGRITDAEDRPMIGVRVSLSPADIHQQPMSFYNFSIFMTDDRGIYRIYGVPAGRYIVSVGESKDAGVYRNGAGYYERMYYEGTGEQAEAKIIEITPGREATGIDIRLGARAETFRATGRIIDAASNQPLPGVSLEYGALVAVRDKSYMGARNRSQMSDANGVFRVEGLSSGRYAIYVASERSMEAESSGETYSDPTIFEVADKDTTDLEVRVQRGASISGVAVIEGTTDKAVLARLSQLKLGCHQISSQSGIDGARRYSFASIAANGSFRVGGLAPGKVTITSMFNSPQLVGLTMQRTEFNGVEHKNEFEVKSGEQVTGVRVIFAYGTARVRGQVNIIGGTVPENNKLYVVARPGNASQMGGGSGDVDERGRFTLENMPEGEYELFLRLIPMWMSPRSPAPMRLPDVKQNITVTNGAESQVTLVLDLSGQTK